MNFIYDPIRKKKLKQTPEEKIRQFFIHYITSTLHYPKSALRIEKKIYATNQIVKKRPDIVIYDQLSKPFIVVECKSENVNISNEDIIQVTNYNKYLKAPYVIKKKKKNTFCWELKHNKYVPTKIPNYNNQ